MQRKKILVVDDARIVRQQVGTALISSWPVVMLTTEVNISLVTRAKAAGAKAWMVKPFIASALISTAKKLSGSV